MDGGIAIAGPSNGISHSHNNNLHLSSLHLQKQPSQQQHLHPQKNQQKEDDIEVLPEEPEEDAPYQAQVCRQVKTH